MAPTGSTLKIALFLGIKIGCSPRPLCITSYYINSISKNAPRYTYDLVGNRITQTSLDTIDPSIHQDNTLYDDLNRAYQVQSFKTGANAAPGTVPTIYLGSDQYQYDGAGRVVLQREHLIDRPDVAPIDDQHVSYRSRYNVYDAVGKLQATRVAVRDDTTTSNLVQLDDINYAPAPGTPAAQAGAGYDEAGNLLGYTDTTRVNPYDGGTTISTRTHTTYAHLGGYAQAQVESVRTNPDNSSDTATSTTWYDANGFVSQEAFAETMPSKRVLST